METLREHVVQPNLREKICQSTNHAAPPYLHHRLPITHHRMPIMPHLPIHPPHRPSLSPQARSQRWLSLLLVMTPIVGSFVYNQGVRLPFLDGCPLLRSVGIPCPAWGLTRSFMAVARGEFAQAFAYHWFGPLLFVGFCLACLHFLLELRQNRKIKRFYVPWVRNPELQISAFLLLLIYHGFRLYNLAQSGFLYTSFRQSPVGQWLN